MYLHHRYGPPTTYSSSLRSAIPAPTSIKMVANSLGGTLPGEALMPHPHVPHPRPFYTPIADIDGRYVAGLVSFGMWFARRFANATLLELDFDPDPVNATAYAARLTDGRTFVAIINKDARNDLRIYQPKWQIVETLTAPKLASTKVILGPPLHPRATMVPASSAGIFDGLHATSVTRDGVPVTPKGATGPAEPVVMQDFVSTQSIRANIS